MNKQTSDNGNNTHGKYGHYLTFPMEKMDINVAENLIEYKIKMSEQWMESKSSLKKSR
jgi:hypothetical protein